MTQGKLPHKVIGPDSEWTVEKDLLPQPKGIDRDKIRQAMTMMLEAIGEDPNREGLRETPARIAHMYEEIFSGLQLNSHDILATRFHVDHEEIVMVKDIHFYSMCEHHLLPFMGVAHVAYLPNAGAVTGLSKLARLVNLYARRPQVQERLTNQIADTLQKEIQARGSFAMVEAEHLCMSMRGIQKPGTRTITVASRGVFKTDSGLREELFRLLQ